MFSKFVFVCLMVLLITVQAFTAADMTSLGSQSLSQGRPTFFTENKGQWDEAVLFKVSGGGGLTTFIERDGFSVLSCVEDRSAEPINITHSEGLPEQLSNPDRKDRYPSKAHSLKFKFKNTLPSPIGNFQEEQTTLASASSFESSERLSWNNNYFIGNDHSKWAANCGNFQRVVLKDVWDGVDVAWRIVGKQVEFDFLVHPNTDPDVIRVECLGLTGDLKTTSNGEELIMPTSLGILRQAIPEAYQIEPDGSLEPVRAEFLVGEGSSFGVALPEGWDKTKTLVVDPLLYSTYLGGSGYEFSTAIIPDGEGGVLVAGYCESQDFPGTAGAYQEDFAGGVDAFVARMTMDLSTLLYCTYLGSDVAEGPWHGLMPLARGDIATGLTLDGAGGVVVAGYTYGGNFPITQGAFQTDFDGERYDAFVSRLNADGSELIYSTYLGGDKNDFAYSITSDGDGDGEVIVGGATQGNFPVTQGAYSTDGNGTIGFHAGYYDGFVTRLSADGSELIYSTYFGSNYGDQIRVLISDGAGGVIAGGDSYAAGAYPIPTTQGAYQEEYGGGIYDGFIIRLNPAGSDLIYSTYIGGNGVEFIRALALNDEGGVVVGGDNYNGDFPTTEGALREDFGGGTFDGFVISLNADGSDAIYSTYMGGSANESVYGLVPDGTGGVVLAGWNSGPDFPVTQDAYQSNPAGNYEAVVARLDAAGNLIYGTYLGGSGGEAAYALCSDGTGGVVMAGYTTGNFPIAQGAYQTTYGGGDYDAFIARLDIGIDLTAPVISVDNEALDFGTIILSNTADLTFTITNDGTDVLEIDDITVDNEAFSTNFGGSITLNPGESVVYIVTFNPQEIGQFEAEMSIISNDPDNGDVKVSLSGEAIQPMPNITVDPASLDFGNVEFNRTSDPQVLTVTNLGDADLDVTDITIADGQFAFSFGGQFTLTPSASRGFSVTFTPNTAEDVNSDVIITSNDPDESSLEVPLLGTGVWVPSSCLLGRLCEWVGDLLAADKLNRGQANSLCVKTRNATRRLERNKPDVAIRMLEAFNHEVTAYIQGSVLSEEDGRPLIIEANFIIALITEFGTAGFDDHPRVVKEPLPIEIYLSESYPNPFNSTTHISFGLPEASQILVRVFDVNGRELATLTSGEIQAGNHTAVWNAEGLTAGIYLIRMETPTFNATRKVTFVK
jgi:hypothetical protein